MTTNIGITDANRQVVAGKLAKLLADEYLLYTKTRNAHWNVEGPDFFEKHKFFESQYEQLDNFIDDIAERIRAIGHYAPASLNAFLKLTSLTEETRETKDSKDFISALLADHESIIMMLRGFITELGNDQCDLGTSDFVTGLMEEHEKMAWFLRSHLK
ncbi:MAG: DNA starvation/stationary phase protection protein [Bacteroidetes bacterium]|nr:DNA starvation/stationary phase protection protein [Bacteroidota bacterium]